MAYFNTTDLTPAELEDLAFLRARRSGINEDVEVNLVFLFFGFIGSEIVLFKMLLTETIYYDCPFQEIRSELDGINAQLATIDIPDEELVFV